MVRIRLGQNEAVIQDYRWTSSNKALEEHLNCLLDPGGPETSDPDHDLSAAQRVVRKYDGEMLEFDPPEEDEEPGIIY